MLIKVKLRSANFKPENLDIFYQYKDYKTNPDIFQNFKHTDYIKHSYIGLAKISIL